MCCRSWWLCFSASTCEGIEVNNGAQYWVYTLQLHQQELHSTSGHTAKSLYVHTCVCVCACTRSINVSLCLCQNQRVFFFKVSGEQRVAAVNKNHRRSKTLFTSEGSMGRCRGQPSSEEDSPSYKRGPFSQWWANETDSLFVCVCVFCLYLHATLPRWNKDSMDSFLVSRLLNFFYVILNWGIQISCWYVCGFFLFFLHFHVVNIRWKLLSLAGSSKKKEKRDTPTLPSSTGAH